MNTAPERPRRVSVVISTFNRCESLARILRALEWLDYPEFEVIVVNGPSTDGTEALLDGLNGRVKRASCANRNISESRNIGVRMASGEIVAFIDDDAYPDPGWLDALVSAFEWDEVAASGGPVIGHTGYSYQCWYVRADRFGNHWTDYEPLFNPTQFLAAPQSREFMYVSGGNSAFRRSILVALGGFDEEFEYYLDETDVCCRIIDTGYVVDALDSGFIYHKFLPSQIRERRDVIKDWYHVLKSRFYFGLKHGVEADSFARVCAELTKFVSVTRENVELNFEAGVHDLETREKFERDVVAASNRALELYVSGRTRERPPKWFDEERAPFVPFRTRRPTGRKLHVCLLSQEYPPAPVDGIGRVVRSLATGLARRGHVVRVLTRGEGHPTVDLEDDVWVHRIPTAPHALPEGLRGPAHIWDHSASLLDELHRIEAFRPIDVVQCPNWDSEGIATVLEGHFRTVVGLYTPLSTVLRVDPAMQRQAEAAPDLFDQLLAAESLVYERADAFLACGPAIVREVEDRCGVSFPRHRLGMVAHGLADEAAGQHPAPGRGRTRILFVGRLEARKGIDTLLESAAALAASGTRFELRIAGAESVAGPSGRTYRQEFEHAHPDLADAVRFLGRVDDEALRHEYASCDIFVAPSRFESFGLVLLEAMMFAKPVVSSNVGGTTEIVRDGVSGLLVPPGDVGALTEALRLLVGAPELRERLGQAGRADYEASFTAARMAEEAERFYEAVVRVPGPA